MKPRPSSIALSWIIYNLKKKLILVAVKPQKSTTLSMSKTYDIDYKHNQCKPQTFNFFTGISLPNMLFSSPYLEYNFRASGLTYGKLYI